MPQNVHAVDRWHLEVRNDDVERVLLHLFEGLLTAQGDLDLIAFLFENTLATLANDPFVINDQNPRTGDHFFPLISSEFDVSIVA